MRNRGIPRASHTNENCATVESLIREDPRVEVHEIAEVPIGTAKELFIK
jgi:hypothetical protein